MWRKYYDENREEAWKTMESCPKARMQVWPRGNGQKLGGGILRSNGLKTGWRSTWKSSSQSYQESSPYVPHYICLVYPQPVAEVTAWSSVASGTNVGEVTEHLAPLDPQPMSCLNNWFCQTFWTWQWIKIRLCLRSPKYYQYNYQRSRNPLPAIQGALLRWLPTVLNRVVGMAPVDHCNSPLSLALLPGFMLPSPCFLGSFPNKPLASRSLSQGWLLEKPPVRQCFSFIL